MIYHLSPGFQAIGVFYSSYDHRFIEYKLNSNSLNALGKTEMAWSEK